MPDPILDAALATPSGPAWPDELTRAALQLVAEGVTELAGFGLATISVAGVDGMLHLVAVSGDAEVRAQLTGMVTPMSQLVAELGRADDWGHFKFVPHERAGAEPWGWVPEQHDRPSGDDGWHPLDLLIAPLYDGDDALRGTLAIDRPTDGRHPDADRRARLERFADQAERAIVKALDRERLAQRVRLAAAVRDVVRRGSAGHSVAAMVQEIADAVLSAFDASSLWVRMFDGTDRIVGQVGRGGSPVVGDDMLRVIGHRTAMRLWTMRAVGALGRHGYRHNVTGPAEETARIEEFLGEHRLESVLYVPLGVGEECLGSLAIMRSAGGQRWSQAELEAAAEIGHDLGQVLLSTLAFEREQKLLRTLRELDAYKSRLIGVVCEELGRPLATIAASVDGLRTVTPPDGPGRLVAAMDRSTRRMVRLVDDLALLSKVGDPATPVVDRPVDLVPIVREVCQLTEISAQQRDLTIRVQVPDADPMLVLGDEAELDRVVLNLVSNAVKYTPDGRSVTVALHRKDGAVELVVADEGIGISKADQERLFSEFFRSTNPEALRQPGTGLGLAIVERVVRRHGGHVEVDSELGRGSVFRVRLAGA